MRFNSSTGFHFERCKMTYLEKAILRKKIEEACEYLEFLEAYDPDVEEKDARASADKKLKDIIELLQILKPWI
jgi:tRNA nucleotidyltransferase/poly(A) polymerase